MKSYFNNLFKYNNWANQVCLAGLEKANPAPEKALSIFSHIQSAQIIWLNRILGLSTAPFPVWELYKITELGTMVEEGSERWLKFIDQFPKKNFDEVISYKDSTGTAHESRLLDIISHVINHSTYHRGQIALIMRQEELSPSVTDFIVYTRNKSH